MASAGKYDGTITSKMKPIVTMLTEEITRDFTASYRYAGKGMFLRTAEDGTETVVSPEQLHADVRSWLEGLESEHNDKTFATMIIQMIRKNPGWIALLAGRIAKRLKGGRE